MAQQNNDKNEIELLERKYRYKPQPAIKKEKIHIFISPEAELDQYKEKYQTENVFKIRINPSKLKSKDITFILGQIDDNTRMYVKALSRCFSGATMYKEIIEKLNEHITHGSQKYFAEQKISVYEELFSSEHFIDNIIEEGVNIFDFNSFDFPETHRSIMPLIFNQICTSKQFDEKMLQFVINEAHTYQYHEPFIQLLRNVTKYRRHTGSWIMLDTQEPDELNEKIIKLSDIKAVFRLDLNETNKIKNYFNENTSKLHRLKEGEAYIYSENSNTDNDVLSFKINVRPRFSLHGGKTKSR